MPVFFCFFRFIHLKWLGMSFIDKPSTDPKIDAERPAPQEQQKNQVSQDMSPEILVAEADADLAERIRAVEQDETADRALKDPTIAEYHRLAQRFRKDLQTAGVMETDKQSRKQLLGAYGGSEGYSHAVVEDVQKRQMEMEARKKAEDAQIEQERQASLKKIAETAKRIQEEDPEKQRERFGKDVMEKIADATDEENEAQFIPEYDAPLFESRHVDARLEKVPPLKPGDPEKVFEMFQAMQQQEQQNRDLAERVEKGKREGLAQGMFAEARFPRPQEKSSDTVVSLESGGVKPAEAEGLAEAGKREAPVRSESGGMFSLQDLMKEFPEAS